MATDQKPSGILGDINPKPGTEEHVRSKIESEMEEDRTVILGRAPREGGERPGPREHTPAGVSGGLATPSTLGREYGSGE